MAVSSPCRPASRLTTMDGILAPLLKLSLVLFMAGSLLEMGLGLSVRASLAGLRNRRFLGYGILFCFIIGPLLAWGLTIIISLAPPYAAGLLLLGMTPCAPFLPVMVNRAQGDIAYAPAMLLLSAVGTVLLLPVMVMVPLMVSGLAVDAWTVARPLLLLVLLPLMIGMVLFRAAPSFATAARPVVKKVTAAAAVVLLALCVVMFGRGFALTFGSFAVASQVLYLGLLTSAGYWLSRGLPPTQRSVLGLGLCTRNVGAALAPLFSAAAIDQRVTVMVALGVPVQVACGLLAAYAFARDAKKARPKGEVPCRSG